MSFEEFRRPGERASRFPPAASSARAPGGSCGGNWDLGVSTSALEPRLKEIVFCVCLRPFAL